MHVIRSGECNNSPKNAFVEDLVIDLLSKASLDGRVEDTMPLPAIPKGISMIRIIHAISHGKVGAANGRVNVDGEERPFSIFIEFATTKGVLAQRIDLYLAEQIALPTSRRNIR